MAMENRAAIFVLSLAAVAFASVCIWAYRLFEVRRLRKMHHGDAATLRMFCRGGSFDIDELLKVCQQSPRTYDVVHDNDYYTATLGKKSRTRLTLRLIGDCYVLEKIEHYYDKNMQFTGWFDDYLRCDDEGPLRYKTVGVRDCAIADEKHRLPSFELTENAVEQLMMIFAKR